MRLGPCFVDGNVAGVVVGARVGGCVVCSSVGCGVSVVGIAVVVVVECYCFFIYMLLLAPLGCDPQKTLRVFNIFI